jgi:pyruvate formate lyase activating enzyme
MNGPENRRPLVLRLHHFSLDDGPGIRTTVFFKGCPLACVFCHNPESMDSRPELAFYPERCIGCGDCVRACPNLAISFQGPERIHRATCRRCGACAAVCPALAVQLLGEYYEVPGLVRILLRDRVLHETSGGGITFSGGEPTLYMDYLSAVLQALKNENVHVALQTCGWFEWTPFREKILPYIDLIYYDLKFIDSTLHRRFTGASNDTIRANFARLAKISSLQLVARTPLVPGVTTPRENQEAIADFVRFVGNVPHRFLPYNPGGIVKSNAIGKETPGGIHPAVDREASPMKGSI